METLQAAVQSGRVTTEGDELFYEVRGEGKPLLLIPPGGGDGWHYARIADILADEYRVITFDRRANARSTMNEPQNFEMSQQSSDAVAVLRAVGAESAFVFGNSSGAAITLDMAKTQPQAVRAAIVHEAPLPCVLPNAKRWQRFFAGVYWMSFHFGTSLAALRFMLGTQLPVVPMIKATAGVNQHRKQSSERYQSDGVAAEVLVKLELLPVTNYLPDFETIRKNGVRMFIAVSQYGVNRKAWYARVAEILADNLGCELVTFPGHHGSFLDQPDEFAAMLRTVLHKAETANP